MLYKNGFWLLIYMYECMATLLNGRDVFVVTYAGHWFAERLWLITLGLWFFSFLFFCSALHVLQLKRNI